MKIEESTIVETNDYKILIYPASRQMSAKEVKEITEKLFDFLPSWNAHGKSLSSSFKIDFSQFIIISIDEEKVQTSGCSIDSLNGLLKQIDQEYQLGLFDRMKACFVENQTVKTMKLQDFRNAIKNKEISTEIEVFDFSKNTYISYLSDFKLPLYRSWAGIYLD
ncbi:MAG: hypothetical protein JST62_12060 [Bacteroidetes bacterium]|nr:hypothetical protein [Bacteroidota bacterium]